MDLSGKGFVSLCPPGSGMLALSHPAPRSRGARRTRQRWWWCRSIVVEHACSAFLWLCIDYEPAPLPGPFRNTARSVGTYMLTVM